MIEELLNKGHENKVTKTNLLSVLGMSERELVKQIHNERKAGALILSTTTDGGGYFLPANDAELKAYIKSMENRAANTFVAIRSARAALKEDAGQLTFSDVLPENDSGKGGDGC